MDHPRVRGEKLLFFVGKPVRWGSPPRVRGKVMVRYANHIKAGITPACAGKSQGTVFYFALLGDHPRVCGEKHGAHFFDLRIPGSPPRVRGKELRLITKFHIIGITPACAGKRLCE